MGKTPWSGWMYPPKDVGVGEYAKMGLNHKLKVLKRYKFYAAIGFPIYFGMLYLTGSTWMSQRKNGGKFYVDLKNDKGSFLMGPPCPKAYAERQKVRIMHA